MNVSFSPDSAERTHAHTKIESISLQNNDLETGERETKRRTEQGRKKNTLTSNSHVSRIHGGDHKERKRQVLRKENSDRAAETTNTKGRKDRPLHTEYQATPREGKNINNSQPSCLILCDKREGERITSART